MIAVGLGKNPRVRDLERGSGPRKEPLIPESQVGLCAHCRHARIVTTPRSRFWLCARSAFDPRYVRYPRLPMLECPGHERGEPIPMAKAPGDRAD